MEEGIRGNRGNNGKKRIVMQFRKVKKKKMKLNH